MIPTLHLGDCLELLPTLEAESVDALVTDPPGGIRFMGREWDTDHGGRQGWIAAMTAHFRECYRVMKPGAHGLVWAIPRTSHWTATALEDAGFEVRDRLSHLFGQGFPKSKSMRDIGRPELGTSLKPAVEDWWLIRKPLAAPNVASQVLATGTGALNVDGNRVGTGGQLKWAQPRDMGYHGGTDSAAAAEVNTTGRWPANLVLSHSPECDGECAEGCPVAELDRQSGASASPMATRRKDSGTDFGRINDDGWQPSGCDINGYADSGGASRFFPTFGGARGSSIMEGWESPKPGATSASQTGAGIESGESQEVEQSSPSSRTVGPGSRPTDPSLKTSRSTTRTTTLRTTSYPTSNSLPLDGTTTTTNGSERTTESLMESKSDSVSGNHTGSPSPSSKSEGLEPIRVTASPARPHISANGESKTESTGTPTTESDANGLTPSSRFFYTAKASTAERSAGLHRPGDRNAHPTVKPTDLMRWLCRLVTPPGGTVLDPFMGSGSTGVAARLEGFGFVGIEKDAESFATAEKRLGWAVHEPGLFG